MYTITLYWAISIQSEFIMPATFRKMGLIKFNLTQTLHKREIYPKFQIFVMLGYIRWKHLSLPHSCQCLGYIMMYSKWLNYFPIFSSRKAISNLRYISKSKFPTCPLIFNFEKLDYSWIYSKSSFNFCTTKLFKEGTYGNNKVWVNHMTLFDPCSVWAIKLVENQPICFYYFLWLSLLSGHLTMCWVMFLKSFDGCIYSIEGLWNPQQKHIM